MFRIFKKEDPKPTLMQKLMKIKGLLTTLMAITVALVYFYGFVSPNFDYFKKSEIKAITIGGAVYVQIDSDRIPNIPVTISFTLDGVDIAHRHYTLGVPSIKGINYEEGKAQWIEPLPLLFTIEDPRLTVRFSFQGLKTLLVPQVITFNTTILDGNTSSGSQQQNKDLFKYEV